ncbi:MAG: hypothetical protein OEZ51_12135 [Nitrospinota bacterium]|nr:hypothetical protein [Nitrospinota bacterium]
MSGISQDIILDVCRLRTTFLDDIGNSRTISGSGFWVTSEESNIFVTNKHNVDPTLKLGADTKYRLETCEVELRGDVQQLIAEAKQNSGQFSIEFTRFFKINNFSDCLLKSGSSDVAIMRDPIFTDDLGAYTFGKIISKEDLADSSFFQDKVAMMDIASFIGYPGRGNNIWFDDQFNAPIARLVNIASWPKVPFSNKSIPTKDTLLVSGLSFSGSSGSVVLLHEKGVKAGQGLKNPDYVPPKVLGIMSGHWWEPNTGPEMFSHSGLSYFTRSTSILALMEKETLPSQPS